MNIKMNSITSYTNFKNNNKANLGIFKGNATKSSGTSMVATIQSKFAQDTRSEKQIKNDKLRDLIRGLTQPQNKTNNNKATISGKTNGYLDLTSTYEKKAKASLTKYKYSYKDVSSRIRSAKTSVSAGQAVIAAKRKVMEIKRKLVSKQDDSELQAALIHAERMEMAARKKMHNLEQEELVSNTMKRDKANEKAEANSNTNEIASLTQEKISEKEDAIFEEKYKMLEDMVDEVSKRKIEELSDEMIEKMNQMIESFGEDELQELEEMMELAESMEIIDPHMSEEEFNKLKAKHRASEEKAIMKADLDYLKSIIKMTVESQLKATGATPISMGVPSIGGVASVPTIDLSSIDAQAPTGTEGGSVDLSL